MVTAKGPSIVVLSWLCVHLLCGGCSLEGCSPSKLFTGECLQHWGLLIFIVFLPSLPIGRDGLGQLWGWLVSVCCDLHRMHFKCEWVWLCVSVCIWVCVHISGVASFPALCSICHLWRTTNEANSGKHILQVLHLNTTEQVCKQEQQQMVVQLFSWSVVQGILVQYTFTHNSI